MLQISCARRFCNMDSAGIVCHVFAYHHKSCISPNFSMVRLSLIQSRSCGLIQHTSSRKLTEPIPDPYHSYFTLKSKIDCQYVRPLHKLYSSFHSNVKSIGERSRLLSLDESYSCRFCKFVQKTVGFDNLGREDEEEYLAHIRAVHGLAR